MQRWIVNASERTVTEIKRDTQDYLEPGEFYWDGTYTDAMAAGARRRMAEEALEGLDRPPVLVCVLDRIEAQPSAPAQAIEFIKIAQEQLEAAGYDVWREGCGLVVLGRLP